MSDALLTERLVQLERAVRRQRLAMCAVGAIVVAALVMPATGAQQAVSDTLRTRNLVVEDVQGRPRIVMGAPLPSIGGLPRSGIRINDPDGAERLGLNLFDDGRMVVGLDAPRGAGDDRNRERINLVADAKGGSTINFKDRRTYIVGRIYLDGDNQLWMEFNDYAAKPGISRRIGLKGDNALR
jgi:hypothetical protein